MEPTRVLIVDDVPTVGQQLSLLLWLSGDIAVVGVATDGRQAIRLAEALEPEVILMDLELPELDGCQAACQIKARLPRCRVIALTIHDTAEIRQKCREAGMEAFINKTSGVDVLLKAIRRPGEAALKEEGDGK